MEIVVGSTTVVIASLVAFLIIGGALTILIGEINDWWSKQHSEAYIEEDPPPQEKQDWTGDNIPF